MVEKQVRITIDLKFKLDDISRENVKEDSKYFSNYQEIINDPNTWETASRQNRLLNALLEDEDVLNTILTKFAVERYLEQSARGEVHGQFDVEAADEQILEPIFAGLDEDDRTFFREVISEGLFSENTSHVWNRLEPKESNISIDILA